MSCRRAGSDDRGRSGARPRPSSTRVAREGDKALYALAEEIDGVRLTALRVSEEEFAAAERAVSDELKRAIDVAVATISGLPPCAVAARGAWRLPWALPEAASVPFLTACRTGVPGRFYGAALLDGADAWRCPPRLRDAAKW